MARRIAVAVLTAWAIVSAGAAHALETQFLIKRKDKVIGYHRVVAATADDGVAVSTEIAMSVKLGPIPLFRYSHANDERWRDGALLHAASRTDNNGDKSFFRAARVGDALHVKSSAFVGAARQGLVPSSWWNKAVLDADQLISTQTGEIIDITVEHLGRSAAPSGLMAEHYRIVGSVELDIWYDGHRWVGSRFVIDGETLEYELVNSPAQFARLAEFLR